MEALYAIIALVAGAGIGWWFGARQTSQRLAADQEAAENSRASIIADAETTAREIILQAKDQAIKTRDEAEQETKRGRRELEQAQEQLNRRREKLDDRLEQTENRARKIEQREKQIDALELETERLKAAQQTELERVAGLSRADAKSELLDKVALEARNDSARIIREIEMAARAEGEARAREIVITCIQRLATDVVADVVVSSIELPSDDMKGRIIGRQGRNIRAFEQATGVDVIVDDTPETIVISCFDPVRREVARRTMLQLIADGRIHPGRVEQVLKKMREEVERTMRETGEEAAYRADVRGLHPEILKLMGRMMFRTSYGQNVLNHSVETAQIAALLAAEVGADIELARTGGFLHDIGKAMTHEVDGPHALIGADILQRYGIPPLVVNAVASHHHEVEQDSLEAVLVETADAISGARPGARRESLELYIKRIKALETIAEGFAGVEESFAIQAGREVRIIVRPEQVDDLGALRLSQDIAKKIEETLEYPGQVKVTVIRETRAVEYAR
jgi:ribonuclease Y